MGRKRLIQIKSRPLGLVQNRPHYHPRFAFGGNMPALVWSSEFELGLDPMDDTHREFVDLVNRVTELDDAQIGSGLDQLIEHTIEHFAQEDRWMRESGFPPTHCHQSEHDRVLEVMRDVRGHVERGDLALGRNLIRELPAWFENHAATMDAALAWYVSTTGYRATAGSGAAVADAKTGCGSVAPSSCGCAGAVQPASCG